MNSPIALFAKSWSAAILKNLGSFLINESPRTKIRVQDCQLAVSESSDDAMFLHFFVSSQLMGAQLVSDRVFEPRLRAAAGLNLTGVTVLCPWARTLILA